MADLPAKVKALGIQLDRRKPMAEARKLQKDIEITIKKIADGISDLLVCKNKAMAAIAAEDHKERDKWMTDIKKELKKLQRLRDNVRMWAEDSPDINKEILVDARRSIEIQMEWFKEAEKEAKLKPFCKVNLQLGEKLDAPTLAKHQTMHWVSDALVKLCELQETLEADIEAAREQADKHQLEVMQELMTRHELHVQKLEQVMRALENDQILPGDVDATLKENIEWYLDDPAEADASLDSDMYAEFQLGEHIGKLGAHGAHADAAEKEVLEQMQAKLKAKLQPPVKKTVEKKAKTGEALLSKRAQKRLARTKAQAQKGRGHPVEAHISPIPESDAEGSEKSSEEGEQIDLNEDQFPSLQPVLAAAKVVPTKTVTSSQASSTAESLDSGSLPPVASGYQMAAATSIRRTLEASMDVRSSSVRLFEEGEQPAESAVDCKPTAAEQTPASQAVITVPMPLSRRATAKEPLPAAGIWAYAPSLARWAQKEPVDTDLNMYRPADSITGPAAEPQQQPTAEPQQQPKAEPQHAGVASQAVLLPHAQNKSEILSERVIQQRQLQQQLQQHQDSMYSSAASSSSAFSFGVDSAQAQWSAKLKPQVKTSLGLFSDQSPLEPFKQSLSQGEMLLAAHLPPHQPLHAQLDEEVPPPDADSRIRRTPGRKVQADAFLSEEQGHEASTAQDDQKTLPDLPAEGLKQPDDAPGTYSLWDHGMREPDTVLGDRLRFLEASCRFLPTDEDRNYEPGMHLPVQASLRYVGPIHKAPTEFVPDSYPKAWEIPAFLESSGFFRATDADVLHFAATCQRGTLQQQLADAAMDCRASQYGVPPSLTAMLPRQGYSSHGHDGRPLYHNNLKDMR